MHPTRTRLALTLAGAAALAALTGCSAGSDSGRSDDSGGARAAALAESPAPEAQDAVGVADSTGGGARDAKAVGSAEQAGPEVAIIATGAVALEADDVARARLEVRSIVDLQQGTVAAQETSTGEEGEVTAARLVVRVPSARFDAATEAIEKVGTLTDSSSSAEDVSAQVVDVAARVRAQQRSVERIEALLDRAQNLAEVVSIERQLAERRADLDALVARQRDLAEKTSLSTITVSIARTDTEERPDDDETAGGFLDGLREGWDAFAAGVVVTLTALGFLLPWLILAAVLGVPLWLVLRRRAARRPVPAPPLATP